MIDFIIVIQFQLILEWACHAIESTDIYFALVVSVDNLTYTIVGNELRSADRGNIMKQ